jgi:hypothetical protein
LKIVQARRSLNEGLFYFRSDGTEVILGLNPPPRRGGAEKGREQQNSEAENTLLFEEAIYYLESPAPGFLFSQRLCGRP